MKKIYITFLYCFLITNDALCANPDYSDDNAQEENSKQKQILMDDDQFNQENPEQYRYLVPTTNDNDPNFGIFSHVYNPDYAGKEYAPGRYYPRRYRDDSQKKEHLPQPTCQTYEGLTAEERRHQRPHISKIFFKTVSLKELSDDAKQMIENIIKKYYNAFDNDIETTMTSKDLKTRINNNLMKKYEYNLNDDDIKSILYNTLLSLTTGSQSTKKDPEPVFSTQKSKNEYAERILKNKHYDYLRDTVPEIGDEGAKTMRGKYRSGKASEF